MSVLTLAGKPINWSHPPKATDKVKWSRTTSGGKAIIGSLRTIAWLEHVNDLAEKKFGRSITVIQGCYNEGVAASAGTHDKDACLDVMIYGVGWLEQQEFFRRNGGGAYYRTPAQGFSPHIHLFVLPPREGSSVSDDYRVHGFVVGKFVDGGYSLYGHAVASSQVEDYYNHRNALASHAHDSTWFPPSIEETVFDLALYAKRQVAAAIVKQPKPKPTKGTPVKPHAEFRVATNNVRSLPKNPNPGRTMIATPAASVLLLQECDPASFHNALRRLPGYAVGSIPKGNTYNAFVAFKPTVWQHVSTKYVKQYDGAHGVSLTRRIAITVLRHKALGKDFAFVSFHRVTAGNDKVRKALRKTGDRAVRREVAKLRAAGLPVIMGCDQNGKANLFPTRTQHVRHDIDHQYAWNGREVALDATDDHAINTWSDHDALVTTYTATIK